MTGMSDIFNAPMHADAFDILAGEWIGQGIHREVWSCAIDASLVVKFETGRGNFANVYEHEVWEEVKDDKELSKWFAPVTLISARGLVLLQKRTEVVRKRELPKMVPAFFCDLKAANWGWYEGRYVCHDYGNNALMRTGLTRRMKAAKWWR